MPVLQITWTPTPKQLRLFALAQVAFFAIVSTIVFRYSRSEQAAATVMACSVVAAIVGVCFPRAIHFVYVAWMAALFPIAWIITHLLMATIFYWLLTPIGLIMKLIGRDPLQRKFDRSAATYWIGRKQEKDECDYFKQY